MMSEETKVLAESRAMLGGDGPLSYAQNSSIQRGGLDAAGALIDDGIEDMLDFKSLAGFHTSNTFRIADFGCSVGPNTFFAMENIIEAVERKYRAQFPNSSPLEFQVFFNDVPGNDFNTLFRTLPSDRKYFAFGAPGSFHNRVFPKSTLHFAFSAFAFHWLSKVPKAVLDKKSPLIHSHGYSKEVAIAYLDQFKDDMDDILNARAEEMVGGGLMLILIGVLPDGTLMSDAAGSEVFEVLGSCLIDMANLGEISEEKVDSFNLPLHFPTVKELEDIINRNGNFSIERTATLTHPVIEMSTQGRVSALRALFQGLIEEHFGIEDDVVEKLMQRLANKLDAQDFSSDGKNHEPEKLCILLERNV